uniref:Uncharacterized protein n=1 Tax=Fundulus heteroclitus TaxID=8078 RepID=A0A3Q2Q0R8_FUNHE
MPRRGRRSEGAKKRWRRLDHEDLTPPTTSRVWSPTQSPLIKQWPRSDVTGLSHKLVLPAEAPEKKFALLVGDSHLRAIADGFVTMPEGKFSFGFLATPGASAAQLRREVQKAVLTQTPKVVCLLAPSNNLTASRTPEEAAVDFDDLLATICSRWPNVVVEGFPPRLVVEESLQLLLRQVYHRVAARRSVRYLSVGEYFPLSRLELWSKDGVHLSDSPGMEVLAQLLWVATYTQLEASEPKSPAPVTASPPPVASPCPSNPFEWTLVEGGQKQQVQGDVSPHTSKRMVDQQGDLLDPSIPPNPVWFSPALVEEMDRIVPSSGCDFLEPHCAPKGKKVCAFQRLEIAEELCPPPGSSTASDQPRNESCDKEIPGQNSPWTHIRLHGVPQSSIPRSSETL